MAEAWGKAETEIGKKWDTLKANASNNFTAVKNAGTATADAFETAWEDTKKFTNTEFKAIAKNFKTQASDPVVKETKSMSDLAAIEIEDVTKVRMPKAFSDMVQTEIPYALRPLAEKTKDAGEKAGKAMQKEMIDNFEAGVDSKMRSLGVDISNPLYSGFKNKLGGLLESSGALGGLAGIIKSALPAAAAIQLGFQLAGPIVQGMKKAFGAIKGFVGGLFGGDKATIESAWDPRILEVLFAQGYSVGDKVSKDQAKAIAQQVGAGQGLKDGFSFRDLKGSEEKRDRQRTNQEALEASIKEAQRAGVKLTQEEIDRILGKVTATEIANATEVKDHNIAASEEVKAYQVVNYDEIFAAQTEKAAELHNKQMENVTALHNKQMENVTALHNAQMGSAAQIYHAQLGAVRTLKGIIDGMHNTLSGSGGVGELMRGIFGDAVVEELNRRSAQGEQVVYDAGVQSTGNNAA